MDVFKLTEKQKKAFDKLAKAYKACEAAGVYFVNNYGSLEAYNKAYVKEYTDAQSIEKSDMPFAISTQKHSATNRFAIANEWTDDEHMIILTEEGKFVYDAEMAGD